MISESKLDDSFLHDHFLIGEFHTPFRFDHNKNGGGILLHVREDIPAKILSHDFPSAESFFVEIILHKKKWLINCSYNPNKNNINNHLEIISKALDAFSTKYENIILPGDFNVCVDDEAMRNFCNSYNLNSLIKQPTCFKNPENPSYIDLILTNKSRSFKSTCVTETGLSDFHRMTISVLKTHFCKLPPEVVTNRSRHGNERFMDSLKFTLNSQKVDYTKNPQFIFELCWNELEHHAPEKKKHICENNKPFMTKAMSNSIMERTRL